MGYRFMCYPGGVRKAVTFSYDDGCRDDIRLAEIFNKYKMKGTFNLNSNRLIKGDDLTVEDAKRLLADGHEIAVHGKQHRANGITRLPEGIKDVLLCREELEEALGVIIRGMAYPDTGITNFSNGVIHELSVLIITAFVCLTIGMRGCLQLTTKTRIFLSLLMSFLLLSLKIIILHSVIPVFFIYGDTLMNLPAITTGTELKKSVSFLGAGKMCGMQPIWKYISMQMLIIRLYGLQTE